MTYKMALLCYFFLVATFMSFAQGDDVPAGVKETFKIQYPAAEDVAYKDNLITINVHFTQSGEKLIANYTRKGKWKETEKDWTFEQLPADVKDGFDKSKYAGWKVGETKMIFRSGGTERYRIKAEKSDLQKKYLFFNKNGRLTEDLITL